MQAKLTALCTDTDLLKAIHPTAAVSGLPQQQAKKALAEIETFDRRWYAGTLGVMNQHLSEFLCHHSFGFYRRKTKCVYLLEPVLWKAHNLIVRVVGN